MKIDLVGDRSACEYDCPSLLAKWIEWWHKQSPYPIALLDAGHGYLERVDAKARNMVRKADRLYTYRLFDYNAELDAMYEINTSKAVRSGGEMSERYRMPLEPIRKPWNTCRRHRSVWYGGYDETGKLVAYCNLVLLNELGVVNTILGHADAPAAMNGLIAHMAEDAPVRWLQYLSLASSPDGLRAFKQSVGFYEATIDEQQDPVAVGKRGITLASGGEYPHSFGPLDRDRLEMFVRSHDAVQPLRDFAQGNHELGTLSMRHDVDHSAEHALRFARWEAERGWSSSYYLLPTAAYYYRDAHDTALELEELGHEVGIHNDAMSAGGSFENAVAILRGWVAEMRGWGIAVAGCADHGGRLPNTDMWRKHGLAPADVGLEYEAYLLGRETPVNYISDNAGAWQAPLERREDRPTLMLVHPCHWQLPDRFYTAVDEPVEIVATA